MAPSIDNAVRLDLNAANLASAQDAIDDSDWEYEYDQYETEEFYVLLDLSSNVPPLTSRRRPKREGRDSVKRGSRDLDARVDSQPERAADIQDAPEPIDAGLTQPFDGKVSPANDGSNANYRGIGDTYNVSSCNTHLKYPTDRIQILDFHSKNPILAYKGQVYSCHWASALGTDLIFESYGEVTQSDLRSNTQLRAYPTFGLTAATSTRLVAKPVKLTPRQETEEDEPGQDARMGHSTASESMRQSIAESSRKISKAKASKRQAEFLSRLAAIKVARGETDAVPLRGKSGTQQYNEATTTREEENFESSDGKESAEDELIAENESVLGLASLPIESSQSDEYTPHRGNTEMRRRRRGRTRSEPKRPRGRRAKTVGLFKDSISRKKEGTGQDVIASAAGAAEAGEMDATPASWDDIGLKEVVEEQQLHETRKQLS